MTTIRPFTPADYPAIVRLRNAVHNEPVNTEILAESDRENGANPHVIWTRLVAEGDGGEAVGYGSAGHWPWRPANHFTVYVTVQADRRRRGIGTLLLKAVETWALSRGAVGDLTNFMRGDDEESFQWALRRGYYLDLQRTEGVLDLRAWNGDRFAGHMERVEASGLRLLTLHETPPEPLLYGMYHVQAATAPDVPDYEGHIPSWEEWSAGFRSWKAPKVIGLALDGDTVVGVSSLELPRVEGAGAYTGFTGVLRNYRGRGVALAVKLLTVAEAVAKGVPHMRTNNDVENPAMLRVNERLGYRLVPGPRRLKKRLES